MNFPVSINCDLLGQSQHSLQLSVSAKLLHLPSHDEIVHMQVVNDMRPHFLSSRDKFLEQDRILEAGEYLCPGGRACDSQLLNGKGRSQIAHKR